jgi:hypothetical protein
MQVTFPRLADYARGYAVVARDDGVTYELYGGVCGPALPHDLIHFITERELGIPDGIWGGIAAGLVFPSMVHVSGRRPPHASDRSRRLLRDFEQAGLRAELLADLVAQVATADDATPEQIRRMAAARLSVLPSTPADPTLIAAAAEVLRSESRRWSALPTGGYLCYQWPAKSPRQRNPVLRS